MQCNAVFHPAKLRPVLGFLVLWGWAVSASAATVHVPFGSHSFTYATHIKPSTATQTQLDNATKAFYDNWKAAYYAPGCAAGQARINYDGGNQTVSEAHGYGMLIFPLMAGYDANAQAEYDAMYQYYKAHPANAGATRLLAWKQDSGCNDVEGDDTASDGDLDIAFSLLLADRQWGSCGAINYKSEGVAMINQLKAQDLDASARIVKLGNWATTGTGLTSTRSSDFMPDHYRSFQWATGDSAWNGLINHTYFVITATANASTGLMPDFIQNALTSPSPAPPNFLEDPHDPDYNWNACRDPWRLATDYLVSGDARAYAAVQKIALWTQGAPISGDPTKVKAGYTLPGVKLVNYGDRAFTVPFAVASMVDASDQTVLNNFWASADVGGSTTVDYFGDSIKMLCMIVISGNWWTPEAMPDPCNLSSPTSTPTRTPTRTATRTPTRTATQANSPTRTATASATWTTTSTPTHSITASVTPSRSSTASLTPSLTGSRTPSVTTTDTPTDLVTLSASPSPAGSPTQTPSPAASPSVSPSQTLSAFSSTPTESVTVSPTLTLSPIASSTASPTETVVAPTTTPTSTAPIATASPSPSAAVSATLTGTPSATPAVTAQATFSATPSATPTLSPTATLTPTGVLPTATASPTVTAATALPRDGPLVIDAAQAWPQPNPRWLSLKLAGPADTIHLRVYSSAWVLVADASFGPQPSAWTRLPLPDAVTQAANGPYYFQVQALRDTRISAARKGILFQLR